MTIDKTLDQIYKIPHESKNTLISCITLVSFPKGYILLKADCLEKKHLFYQGRNSTSICSV